MHASSIHRSSYISVRRTQSQSQVVKHRVKDYCSCTLKFWRKYKEEGSHIHRTHTRMHASCAQCIAFPFPLQFSRFHLSQTLNVFHDTNTYTDTLTHLKVTMENIKKDVLSLKKPKTKSC